MKKKSLIYVAGHRGLIGSAIVRRLEDQGYLKIITRASETLDLRSQAAVENFFQSFRPEYVFLAAAKTGGMVINDRYPTRYLYDNLMIEANVIHAAHTYGVKKLLFVGDSCIYPRLASSPLKEEYLLTGELEPATQGYAIAKNCRH